MKFFILSFFLMTSVFAKEGGNGGGVHDCGTSVELYDFFEGRNPILHGLPVWTSDPQISETEYLARAMAHLKKDLPMTHTLVAARLRELMLTGIIVFQEGTIPIIADADIPFVDAGCSYRQVANWNENFGLVFIDRPLYERMDGMSRAGLILHEVLYKFARDNGTANVNSNRIRKIVAKIFSDEVLLQTDERMLHMSRTIPVSI